MAVAALCMAFLALVFALLALVRCAQLMQAIVRVCLTLEAARASHARATEELEQLQREITTKGTMVQ